MNAALELAGVALAALLSENMVLVSSMGVGTDRLTFEDPRRALRTGACLTLVMVLGGLCAWLLDHLLLGFLGWQHLRLLCFSLLIPGLVAALRRFFRACIPLLSQRWDDSLATIPTNCAALGSALLITERGYGLLTALVFTLFAGLGVTLAVASFASLQTEVDLERCPRFFRGIPIKMITAGLMAMGLMGFYGLHLS